MTHPTSITRQAIRTPRAAAVAGIVFSALLTAAMVLVRVALPSDPNDARDWLADGAKRDAALLALNLLPFAGIAFLWFIGVVRDRIGEGEDRFFATVFLGSGLLFIAMVFGTGAVAAASCCRRKTPVPRRVVVRPAHRLHAAPCVRDAYGRRLRDLHHHDCDPPRTRSPLAHRPRRGQRGDPAALGRGRSLDRGRLPRSGCSCSASTSSSPPFGVAGPPRGQTGHLTDKENGIVDM